VLLQVWVVAAAAEQELVGQVELQVWALVLEQGLVKELLQALVQQQVPGQV